MKHCLVVATCLGMVCSYLLFLVGCGGNQSSSDPGSETLISEAAMPILDVTATLDGDRIIAADTEPHNWLSHGRTYDEQRFSPLNTINRDNVADLQLAWVQDSGSKRGLEATPIVVDGYMFTTGAWSTVHAYDAKTGQSLWDYDPKVPKSWGKYACCDVVNRGVAVWKGRVYVGTLDGRLVALNAATGLPDWEVLTIDPDRPYTITGAPRIVKDMVIIGNGGAELGVRGYITAYDTETGDQKWRFFTVPGDPSKPFENRAMEQAAKTWQGEDWWEIGGGGTVWDSMAYDPELNLLYIGVGNGSPWNRHIRSPGGGDNLYLSSILALNPDRGSLIWHYQTTPGDSWDYTATQHIILADMEIDGVVRKVLVQAPKNGFFYVIDRTDGQFISAEPYVPVTWASHVDPETGRPVETPTAEYANEAKLVFPGPLGGHNWHPMTYSPLTRLVYIPALDMGMVYGTDTKFEYEPGRWNLGIGGRPDEPPTPSSVEELVAGLQSVKGRLLAWDPVKQREAWRVEHASSWNGGLLSTAGGLVFQGRSDGMFAAYGAEDGALLWETEVYTGIIAAPVTYAVDGEQYVAIVAGWGGAFALATGVARHKGNVLEEGRVLAFKLNGSAEMPEPDVTFVNIPHPPDIDGTPDQLENGRYLFSRYCSTCHGAGVVSSGQLPDLKYLPSASHDRWKSVVHTGVLEGVGMPGFSDVMSESDAEDIQRYVVAVTREAIALCESEYLNLYPELLDTACEIPVIAEATEP